MGLEDTGEATSKPFDFSVFPERVNLANGYYLDAFTPDDASALQVIVDSDEAIQDLIPWASEDKSNYIERVTKTRATRGPRYAIRKPEGVLIGHFAVFPSGDLRGVIELGYVLAKEARGIGLTNDIIPIMEKEVQTNMPNAKLALCIRDGNIPSQKIAARHGYEPTEQMSGQDRVYFKTNTQ